MADCSEEPEQPGKGTAQVDQTALHSLLQGARRRPESRPIEGGAGGCATEGGEAIQGWLTLVAEEASRIDRCSPVLALCTR
jgi:hypothetical protein